jgi:two-component system NtrC family sensor kinase
MSADDLLPPSSSRPEKDRVLAEIGRHLLTELRTETAFLLALESLHGNLPLGWAGIARREGADLVLADAFRPGEEGGLVRIDPPPLTFETGLLGESGAGAGALRDYLGTIGIRELLELPLDEAQRPGGSLLLARAEPAFSRAEVDLATAVARLMAAALSREARWRGLEQRVEERAAELSAIHEVGRSLSYALDFEAVARVLFDAAERLVGGDAVALLLDLSSHKEVALRLGRPCSTESLEGLKRDVIAEYEARSGLGGIDLDLAVRRSPEYAEEEAPLRGPLPGGATVPLSRRGKTAGLLRVARRSPEPVPEERLRLLFTVASQASLAIDRIETLHERERSRVRQMLDSMPQGVLLADPDLQVLVANPAARGMLALLAGSPEPARLERVGGLDLAELAGPVLAGETDRAQAEISLPEARRIFALSLAPVRRAETARDRRPGVVLLIDDVTETRRLQEQMSQTEKLSALGEMIAGVAHELNNPLSTVMGYAQILQSSEKEGPLGRKLETLHREARRCQKIVQNLLSFARKHEPRKQPLSLSLVIESVLQLVRYQLRVAGIEVQVTLDSELPPVLGDQHALQQVFINLITNAQHAMEEKGGGGVLRIQGRAESGQARIELSDTGVGIPPEDLKRIFDPFFTTKEVGKGTGLGLSLAYGTVRDHGGEVLATSRAGEGTTFVVVLPAASSEEIARSVEAARGRAVEPPRRQGRILVVEDEASVAEVLREALEAQGHRVEVAADGESARERLDRGGVDLVISDLRMPHMSGPELYDQIVAAHPDMSRKVVFATGDLVSAETRRFCERTGNPVLEKPFDLGEVRRVVARALGPR